MQALPTTTVTLFPSSGVDEWSGARTEGDPITGVPASLIEQSRTVRDPNTGDPRTARFITGRFPDGTPITTDTRVVDAQGHTYAVRSVRQLRNPLWITDVTVELVRNDSTAT